MLSNFEQGFSYTFLKVMCQMEIGQPISTCSAPYMYLIRSRVAQIAIGFPMMDTF